MHSYAPKIVTECDNYEGRDDNDDNDDKNDEKLNMILKCTYGQNVFFRFSLSLRHLNMSSNSKK